MNGTFNALMRCKCAPNTSGWITILSRFPASSGSAKMPLVLGSPPGRNSMCIAPSDSPSFFMALAMPLPTLSSTKATKSESMSTPPLMKLTPPTSISLVASTSSCVSSWVSCSACVSCNAASQPAPMPSTSPSLSSEPLSTFTTPSSRSRCRPNLRPSCTVMVSVSGSKSTTSNFSPFKVNSSPTTSSCVGMVSLAAGPSPSRISCSN